MEISCFGMYSARVPIPEESAMATFWSLGKANENLNLGIGIACYSANSFQVGKIVYINSFVTAHLNPAHGADE